MGILFWAIQLCDLTQVQGRQQKFLMSRRVQLLVTLQSEIIGPDFLHELYEKDEDFEEIWEKYLTRQPAKDSILLTVFFSKEIDYVLQGLPCGKWSLENY